MDYATLGKTGLKVSRLGFGGAPIGLQGYLGHEDRESAEFRDSVLDAIRLAVERGITYFDTAPGYGDGRSERLLGEALEPTRDRVVLATKYPFEPNRNPEEWTARLRASLDRLRTDYVDVLQFHGGFFTDDLAGSILSSGVLDWVDQMQEQGLCRFRGITAEGPSGALEQLLHTGRFDVIEINYSLVYQSTCDYQREPTGIIPLARSLGIGITTMRTSTSGFLSRLLCAAFPQLDPEAVTRLAINYVLSTPEVDCAVVGMKKVSEVLANVRLASDPNGRLNLKELHDRYR